MANTTTTNKDIKVVDGNVVLIETTKTITPKEDFVANLKEQIAKQINGKDSYILAQDAIIADLQNQLSQIETA